MTEIQEEILSELIVSMMMFKEMLENYHMGIMPKDAFVTLYEEELELADKNVKRLQEAGGCSFIETIIADLNTVKAYGAYAQYKSMMN